MATAEPGETIDWPPVRVVGHLEQQSMHREDHVDLVIRLSRPPRPSWRDLFVEAAQRQSLAPVRTTPQVVTTVRSNQSQATLRAIERSVHEANRRYAELLERRLRDPMLASWVRREITDDRAAERRFEDVMEPGQGRPAETRESGR